MDIQALRMKHGLATRSYQEVAELISQDYSLFIPVGSTEQHGAHLPLCTDSLCAEVGALMTAEHISALVAPTISYGVSSQHMRYAGTATLPPEMLTDLVVEVAGSLIRHGFNSVFLFNGHGGNASSLEIATRKLFNQFDVHAAVVSFMFAVLQSQPLPKDPRFTRYFARDMAGHGGLIETSLVMAADAALVDLDKADTRSVDRVLEMEDGIVSAQYMVEDMSDTGVFGGVEGASVELGKEMYRTGAEEVARHIRQSLALRKTMSEGA